MFLVIISYSPLTLGELILIEDRGKGVEKRRFQLGRGVYTPFAKSKPKSYMLPTHYHQYHPYMVYFTYI